MNNKRQETQEEKRERIRQNELKNNSSGSLNDSLSRGSSWNLTDLTGGMGWKATGILIVILVVGYALYKLFFH